MHADREALVVQAQEMEKTVVITGAASGIGKATAIEFARSGWNIVAVARSGKGLEELVPECELLGGTVLTQVADVTDQVSMNTVAANAVESFGRIDVWVNNAGVILYGKFGEEPHELYRQVMETNFFGCVHGSRAALPYFREQKQGVLINVASFAGKLAMPFSSAYSASKAAIGVFSQALRMELLAEPDIHVCTVFPASIDTPLYRHAANYSGRGVRPISPVYLPDRVAKRIVRLAGRPKGEVLVGSAGRAGSLMHVLMPALSERVMAHMVFRRGFQDRAAPITDGNLFQSDDELTGIDGGWTSSRERSALRQAMIGIGALGPGIGALGWLLGRLYLKRV